jgi:hypothetical protein
MLYATRVMSVIAIATLVAAPAHAFGGGGGGKGGKRRPEAADAESRQKATKERENAYQNALKGIPDGKPNRDPWAGAR